MLLNLLKYSNFNLNDRSKVTQDIFQHLVAAG